MKNQQPHGKSQLGKSAFFALIVVQFSIAFFAQASDSPTNAALEEKIKRVENGLLQTVRITGQPYDKMALADRLVALKVPAISVAVANGNRVEWAKAYGLRDIEAKSPATIETLFQAASISKPVSAAAALHFVEKGLLDLDEDVNAKLVSWKIPENEFTAKTKVTLRHILSHSAGLTVHGFLGYPTGQPVPTLRQVLDGEKPANSVPIRVDILPGSLWRYSGGGFTVMQQMLIDVLGKPFPDILKEAVLAPAGMTQSVFAQPLSEARLPQGAVGYRSAGKPVEGGRYVYPELAAAGLWTTPTDLCRFAMEIMNAYNGKPGKILSPEMARKMLTVQKAPSGLGFMIQGEGADFCFRHGGANTGFICDLFAFPAKGIAVAVMTNSDSGGALLSELERSIAAEYGLFSSKIVEKTIVRLEAKTLDRYAGNYEIEFSGQPISAIVSREAGHILLNAMGFDIELYPESETNFFSMDLSWSADFVLDEKGKVTGFILDEEMKAKKID